MSFDCFGLNEPIRVVICGILLSTISVVVQIKVAILWGRIAKPWILIGTCLFFVNVVNASWFLKFLFLPTKRVVMWKVFGYFILISLSWGLWDLIKEEIVS